MEEHSFQPPEVDSMDVLVNLGCSLSQARVYLALARIGTSSISDISKATGIHRENLYIITKSMVEKGLIEKEMSPQTKYSIVPPDVVLPLLVTRKQSQISKLKLEAQTVMGKLGTAQKDIFRNQDAHFMVVTGRNLIIERLKKTLSKTQISVETVTTQKRFQNAILEFAELYRQALERGVKIRLATEEQVLTKETLRILAMLGKYRNFEVRFFPERIPAITAVFDGKEVHICLSITAPLSGAEGLWSNNSCFVAIAKNYFETTWAKCSKLDLSKLAF